MKIKNLPLIALLSGLVVLGFSPSSRAADYVTTVESTPGLLGYWRFTPGTQADSSFNNVDSTIYTGTFQGNAALGGSGSGPALAIDPTNQPVALDGTGDFVNTNLVGGINSAGSIVGWFNLAVLPSDGGHHFAIADQSTLGNDFGLQIEVDNVIRFYTDGGSNVASPTALTAADLNTWIFFAATFTASTTRTLYINGVAVASNVPFSHAASTGTFAMGESNAFTGRFFNGALDEIAIFNRELTATEIATIYASRTVVPEPSTYALILLVLGGLVARRRTRRQR